MSAGFHIRSASVDRQARSKKQKKVREASQGHTTLGVASHNPDSLDLMGKEDAKLPA
ncbi:hypothetical protein GCM10023155_19750 [Bremerella cremea]